MPRKHKRAKTSLVKPKSRARQPTDWEATLSVQLSVSGIKEWVREYRFHPTRMWRFDFAWPQIKLAVEIQGGGRNGRHLRYTGYKGDCEKLCEAVAHGWAVLYVVGEQVKSGEALEWIMRSILERERVMRT